MKTETSKRVIPIGDEILDALKRNRDRQHMLENFNPENYTDNELVVSDDFGNPVISNSFSKRFQRLLEINNFKPCRFHDLRHSFATLMMNSNVPLKIASQLLGHSSVSVTADIYQNPQLIEKMEASRKVTNSIFGSCKEDQILYMVS